MDFSQMSDDELAAIVGSGDATPIAPPAADSQLGLDLAKMSEAELVSIAGEDTKPVNQFNETVQTIGDTASNVVEGGKEFIRLFDESSWLGSMRANGLTDTQAANTLMKNLSEVEDDNPPVIKDEQGNLVWRNDKVKQATLSELGFEDNFINSQLSANQYTPQENDQPLEMGLVGPLDVLIGGPAAKKVSETVAITSMKLVRNRTIRKHLEKVTADPKAYKEAEDLIKFMDSNDIHFTNAFLQGTKSSNVEQFMSKENLFATRDIMYDMEKMGEESANFLIKTLNKLKTQDIDPANITSWEDVNKAGKIIANEVRDHRLMLKKKEFKAWEATKPALNANKDLFKVSDDFVKLEKTLADEAVPPEAVNSIRNILNRFGKPYKDETAKLKKLDGEKYRITAEIRKLRTEQKVLNKSDDPKAMQKSARIEEQVAKKRDALSNNSAQQKELKDVKYMSLKDLYGTIKLINRKLYKPGGSISTKDMDELRGLQIAKSKLMDMAENYTKDPKLKELLKDAKDITKLRTALYGAKDTGGEKLMLAQLLEKGDYKQASQYVTGPSGLENIYYLKKTLGKDSEGYKAASKFYLLDKLGLSKDKIVEVMNKPAGQSFEAVDFTKVSDKLNSLSQKDYGLIKELYGDSIAGEIMSAQKVLSKYSQMEKSINSGDIGLKFGKVAYLQNAKGIAENTSRLFKLTKDATTYYIAKTAGKVVSNQPRFRTLTGGLTGMTAYVAGTEQEDISLEGLITSTILGGVAGNYAGKATRSILESDAKKWVRYIKSGRFAPSKDEAKAIQRIGEFKFNAPKQTPVQDMAKSGSQLMYSTDIGRDMIRYEEPKQDPRNGL